MDMKNSNEKAQIKTYNKKDNSNILYNVTPGQAYLVRKEDFGKMTDEEFQARTDNIMQAIDKSIQMDKKMEVHF
jgi:hypothetical protein